MREEPINHDEVIQYVVIQVKKELENDNTGHDWWHICRVWNLAKTICAKEGGDLFIVELAALCTTLQIGSFMKEMKQ